MLNWNEILSGLALAFAGFAYAFTGCFIFVVNAPFWSRAIAIAGALFGTVATYRVLTSSLPSLGILALMFLSQAATMGFIGGFLPEGMFPGACLNIGTLALGITSRYTAFSQQKTVLILAVFSALSVLFWAADFSRRSAN